MSELLFEQDYCHACRTRFATFFRLRSCNVSSLIKHFHPRGRRTAWSSSKSISWLWPERLCAEFLVWVLIFCLFDALVAVRSSSDLEVPLNSLLKKYSAGSGILILVYPGNSQRISHLIKHVLLRFYWLKVITFHIFFCTRKLPSTMLKVILISWPWTTSETWLKMNTVSFIWECEATSPLRPSKMALLIWNLATWRFHLKLIGERRVTSQVLKIKVCFCKLQNKGLSTDLLLFTVGYSIMTRACVAGAG